ncbi:MAG TPA: radical SAM protein [Paracoccaceae bacterium]|nr:radical SAM protein [Paracoccaceae bacterium]
MDGQAAGNVIGKFCDPDWTARGERRAVVPLMEARTLWFNTGTLCNITCTNCYIESSPTNDRLVYLNRAEVEAYLDQIAARAWPVREIGFTGGEPFMNPAMNGLAEAALLRGHQVLILTNAMQPMMRPQVQAGLRQLIARFGERLALRVSLDHFEAGPHDRERGQGSFARALEGLRWLRDAGARLAVAGRQGDAAEEEMRAGFARLFAAERVAIDAASPEALVLFPEMDARVDVPEITSSCWDILHKSPASVMCASSRMVVKRKGADRPVVVSCTLLPYDPRFELGETLAEAERPVALNHPHCAKFCVLGGARCSA